MNFIKACYNSKYMTLVGSILVVCALGSILCIFLYKII